MTGNNFKDEDIIYNEETGLYELYVNGGTVYASGTWESCLAALRKFYFEDPESPADTDYEANGLVNDFVCLKIEEDTIGDYQSKIYTQAVGDVADEIEFISQFGVDVLDIMAEAKKKLWGLSGADRDRVKIEAYDKIRNLVNSYADAIWEEN